MRPWSVGLVVVAALLCAGRGEAAESKLALPRGLQETAAFIPGNNPITPEKVALG